MDICTEGEIPLVEQSSGAKVRCVLYDDKLKFEIARERTLAAEAEARAQPSFGMIIVLFGWRACEVWVIIGEVWKAK
jgi:hypothetical protein